MSLPARERTRAAPSLSLEQAALVADALPGAAMVVDMRAGRLVLNERALRLHGLDGDGPSLLAAEYLARVHFAAEGRRLDPDDSPVGRALRGERVDALALEATAPGGPFVARFHARPLAGDGLALLTIEDAGESERVGEEILGLLVRERLARTEADRERDFAQSVLDEAPLSVGIVEGPEHRFAFVNGLFLHAFGITREALQGRTYAEVVPEGHHDVGGTLDSVYQTGQPRTIPDLTAKAADARRVHLHATFTPLRGPDDRPIGVLLMAVDLTSRKRAEKELQTARRQLAASEKLAAMGSLVSGVAHEIRTPLAYIANNLYFIQARLQRKGAVDAAEMAPLVDSAVEGVDRIRHLVGSLRRFAKVVPEEVSDWDLADAVRGALDLFEATHRGVVTLDARLDATPPVRGDPLQLQQVVLNLLENAADAMPEGGSVLVRTRAADDGALLVVEDRGPGVPPELLGHIFEPFYSTKKEGTGLGLSIVRRIVETHGGSIRHEVPEEGGARFVVTLPLAKKAADA